MKFVCGLFLLFFIYLFSVIHVSTIHSIGQSFVGVAVQLIDCISISTKSIKLWKPTKKITGS